VGAALRTRESIQGFYRTKTELRQVYILAVGMKVKERLFVGGKEFDL